MLDKNKFRAYMALHGDTQRTLSADMSLSLSRLNAKINEIAGAEFTQSEILFISRRYKMKPKDVTDVFFAKEVSEKDTVRAFSGVE